MLIAWVFGADKLASHINKNSNLPFMGIWQFLIRFIAPALLLILLLLEGLRMLKDPYGGYSWWALTSIGIGWIVLTVSAAVILAAKCRDQKSVV